MASSGTACCSSPVVAWPGMAGSSRSQSMAAAEQMRSVALAAAASAAVVEFAVAIVAGVVAAIAAESAFAFVAAATVDRRPVVVAERPAVAAVAAESRWPGSGNLAG